MPVLFTNVFHDSASNLKKTNPMHVTRMSFVFFLSCVVASSASKLRDGNCHNCLYHGVCLCHKVYVLQRISCMWRWNWYAMVKMHTCGYTAYISLFPIWEGCDYCWVANLQYCSEMHERGMSFKCIVSLHGSIHNMFITAKSIVEYHAEQPSISPYKWFRIFSVFVWRIWKWESDCSQWRHL